MLHARDFLPSRERANRRLATLKRTAALGGVSLGLLGPATAQVPPEFAAAEQNPFGLVNTASDSAPAVADIDGDGDLDVLVGERGGSFLFFENTAGPGNTPAFEAPQANPFGLTALDRHAAPSVADLDGDGDLDVLAGERYGNFFYFENTAGPGTSPVLGAPAVNPFGLVDLGTYSTPTVADLDGDGDLDVIASSDPGNLFYFENTAGPGNTPAFAEYQFNPFGLTRVTNYAAPSAADLDADGDLDVLVGDRFGSFAYFENTAGPASPPEFSAPQDNPFGLGSLSAGRAKPAIVDFDGDGDLDVLAGASNGILTYFENTAEASTPLTFGDPQVAPFGLTDIGRESMPTTADIDGDGDLDVLVGERLGGFFYFENTGSAEAPAFAAVQENPFGLTKNDDAHGPALADLDGDGDPDVLSGSGSGDFFYFENTGSATAPAFAAAQTNPFGLTDIGALSAPSMDDLDGDGDIDILAGTYGGSFYYFENTGSATAPAFAAAQANPFGLSVVGYHSTASMADVDGDGDLDVLAGALQGDFYYFENTGADTAPAFADRQANPFGLSGVENYSSPSVRDFDGDGDLDILTGNSDGTFVYFENNPPPVATEPGAAETEAAHLSAPAPNPVVGWTTVRLDVAERQRVQVTVVDVLGRQMLSVFDGTVTGETSLSIDASGLAAGVYVIRAQGETFVAGRPMTVLR